METRSLIRLSNRADIMAIGAHLICCGVPAFMAVLSFITSAGAVGATLVSWAENLHLFAFIFSTIMVAIALTSFALAYRRDCVAEGACHHPPCGSKKTASWRLLCVSLTLYTINVIVFLLG